MLSQKRAERKRRILTITPANLRKQWHQEMQEKFFLPCRILEASSYNEATRRGQFRPFEIDDAIVICSYQFARAKAADVNAVRWDLVVIDEAHRLRNVYKPSNVIANTLKLALQNAPKLLLTATPLQNSLLELFGLVSIIDDHAFGDLKSFREQYANLNDPAVFETLKARLKPLCHRTLRRQVTAYIPYTRRHAMVEEFTPDESEDRLYNLVSEYLRRDNLQALPASQRTLMTLVLRKLLASSTFAIAGALGTLIARLKAQVALRRIEQRIGRCHRYGQKHDVVVVNFLNRNNEADQRVFRLLAEKFSLFEGVFGASDEVLGAIESGVDFEKRIAGIYQRCRTPQEIKASFDQLQLELGAEINDAMTNTRQKLLENFDAEVHDKLRVNLDQSHVRFLRGLGQGRWTAAVRRPVRRAARESVQHRVAGPGGRPSAGGRGDRWRRSDRRGLGPADVLAAGRGGGGIA